MQPETTVNQSDSTLVINTAGVQATEHKPVPAQGATKQRTVFPN